MSAASAGACDKPVDAERLSLLGPPLHHLDRAEAIAGLEKVGVVIDVRTVTASSRRPEPFAPATAARIVCG